jgi:hypothetical protein
MRATPNKGERLVCQVGKMTVPKEIAIHFHVCASSILWHSVINDQHVSFCLYAA